MRTGLGITFAWPMKNDNAATKSANDMRHRCLLSRATPWRAPDRIIRRSPALANSPTTPKRKNGKAGIPFLWPPWATASSPNVSMVNPTANATSKAPRCSQRDPAKGGRTVVSAVVTR